MKTQLSVLALSAILVVSLTMAPVHGQQQIVDTPIGAPIVVATDKPMYQTGETIVVSGQVAREGDGAVSIQIVGPDDSQNRVCIGQPSVNRDGTFETECVAGGPLMKTGAYTVKAQYGSTKSVEATYEFEYTMTDSGDADKPEDPSMPAFNIGDDTVSIEGAEDMIGYEITGGSILSVVPDVGANSLVITIKSTDDGSLTMTIPRTILESQIDGEDTDLFVLIDGEERMFDQETTDEDRTVTIPFIYGDEVIEIIGTWVVPEFGVIAVMILAVAIVSIIAISSRSRLSMVPRL